MNEVATAASLPSAAAPRRGLTVAVTGGSGQLGTQVLRRLIADRAVRNIVSLDRRPPAIASGKLTAIEADVRDPAIGGHFAGCDAVIHLAFLLERYERRAVMDAVNVGGSRNVFTAAYAAGVRRFVYLSSLAAYGVMHGQPVPLVEDTPRRRNADFAYSATKFDVEAFLDRFEAKHADAAVTRLRPGLMLGPWMDNALSQLLRRGLMPSDGSTAPLPLVDDSDVADAVMLALHRGGSGAFNLVADDAMSAAALAAGAGLRLLSVPKPVGIALAHASPFLERLHLMRSVDPAWIRYGDAVMIASSARARDDLGWRPRYATARQVLAHYREAAPRRADPRLVLFRWLINLATRFAPRPPEFIGVRLGIRLCLTGPRGADLGVIIAHGRLTLRRHPPRPADALVIMPAPLFLAMIAGRAEWGGAQLTGKVRTEGQAHAPMVVAGLIASFRARLAPPTPFTRVLSRWIAAGAGA